jgi:Na+/glutamate symporter
MKTKWFKRLGWFYLPVSVPGGLVVLLAVLFCLTVFKAVDRHSHSASDTLYGVFPFFICTFLLVDWIGSRTSEKPVSPRLL